MKIQEISAAHISPAKAYESACGEYELKLSDDARARIQHCRDYLDAKMESHSDPIYGITPCFGSLCNMSIDKDELATLQKNLALTHASATRDRIPTAIDRLILLLMVRPLPYGHSGNQVVAVQIPTAFFNNHMPPIV